ncbi:unnamed protein product [Owenia fusiformis]|uniref:Uncharacterized protein n=1 Tax=Owenia fusiformis TaxID=6347 RepID=A0A8S4NDB0_OWEFU|nr:unnamed protein product [Owenia fusiformis]
MKIDGGKTNNEYLQIYTSKWLEGLMNARYPLIDALGSKSDMPRVDVLFTLVLYILVEFIQSCPEARELLRSREGGLSVSLQLICKYSTNVLDCKSDPQQISKDDINGFIGSLKDLRHKGDEINNLLSSPPFPFPPYWPNPKSPVSITEEGTITKIGYLKERQRWTKWKKVIQENIRQEQIRIGLQKEMETKPQEKAQEKRQREEETIEENILQEQIRIGLQKEMETKPQEEGQEKRQREEETQRELQRELVNNFMRIGPLDEENVKHKFVPIWGDERSDEEIDEDSSQDDEEEGVDIFTYFKT